MCVIGHSKGAENSIICGQTLNHLVDITISSSNHFCGFINNFTYQGVRQNNAVRPDFKNKWHGFEKNEGQGNTDRSILFAKLIITVEIRGSY